MSRLSVGEWKDRLFVEELVHLRADRARLLEFYHLLKGFFRDLNDTPNGDTGVPHSVYNLHKTQNLKVTTAMTGINPVNT